MCCAPIGPLGRVLADDPVGAPLYLEPTIIIELEAVFCARLQQVVSSVSQSVKSVFELRSSLVASLRVVDDSSPRDARGTNDGDEHGSGQSPSELSPGRQGTKNRASIHE